MRGSRARRRLVLIELRFDDRIASHSRARCALSRPATQLVDEARIMLNVLALGVAVTGAVRAKTTANQRVAETTAAKDEALESISRAREDVERELALVYADYEVAMDELERYRADASTLEGKVQELEKERGELSARAKTEREQNAKLRFSLTVANGQKEKMKTEIEQMKTQASEDGKMKEECRRVKERLHDAQKALEAARKNVQELTEKNGAMLKEKQRLEHDLEDAKAAETKLEAARKRNVQLAEELETKHQECSAMEHALEDAEINLRQAESQKVQLALELDDTREQVVQLRAHELELQQELKNMLETLTMVTSHHANDAEGSEQGAGGFASPIEIERVMAKINTPIAERIEADNGENPMQDVQSRMTVLLSRVEECKTPVGISKALAELDELQGKLRDLQSSVEHDASMGSPQFKGSASPDPWPISPPSPVTTSKDVGRDLDDAVNIDEGTPARMQSPPRTLDFSEPTTPPRSGTATSPTKKASPLQRALNSFRKATTSPAKEPKTKKEKKDKKKKGKKAEEEPKPE